MSKSPYNMYQIDFCFCSKVQQRIDVVLSNLPLGLSRSQIAQCCNLICINGHSVKLSHKVTYRDIVHVKIEKRETSDIESVNIDTLHHGHELHTHSAVKRPALDILFEDDEVCVINKARGMVVHPGVGEHSHTVAELIFDRLSSYNEESFSHHRAGIVHRLDKYTSGVLAVAKTVNTHEQLSEAFANRKVNKQYIAIVKNHPREKHGSIETCIARHRYNRKKFTVVPVGGKVAITQYTLLYTNGAYSVIRFMPHTGRTHQLRVHAQHIGCPIIGDPLYARPIHHMRNVPLMLHAQRLDISCINPYYVFTATIPQDMIQVMDIIGYDIKSCQ